MPKPTQALPDEQKGNECDGHCDTSQISRSIFAWIATAATLYHPPQGKIVSESGVSFALYAVHPP
jgi:hypothetical protein